MLNPLSENPALRKRIYAAFWVVGLVLGALQVAFASTGNEADWLVGALATYAFLGTAVGFQAQANTSGDEA